MIQISSDQLRMIIRNHKSWQGENYAIVSQSGVVHFIKSKRDIPDMAIRIGGLVTIVAL